MKGIKIILLILFTISICVGCNSSFSTNDIKIPDSKDTFKIVTLNVGKADCIIISYKDKNIMIDTGTINNKDTILNYLSNNNICTLDYLILTHYDKDHIGSANKITKKINVINVLEPNYTKDSKEYRNLSNALENKSLVPTIVTSNYHFNIEDSEFTVYPPLKSEYNSNSSNEFSLVISIKHGNNTFLLAGDAEGQRLTELQNQMDLSHIFLKIPHHGETDNNSETFINDVNPKYAVITCSKEETPDKKLLKYLDKVKAKTYLSYNGTITALSDGNNLVISQ